MVADNFSGHYIEYEPTNIEVVYLEPNLTSHVQPLDGGIICCVKARYHNKLSLRAIDRDNAGEDNIYKIDILSAMKLLHEAWDDVTQETIVNCWNHVGISPHNDEEWEDIFIDSDAPDSDSDIAMALDDSASDSKVLRDAWGVI